MGVVGAGVVGLGGTTDGGTVEGVGGTILGTVGTGVSGLGGVGLGIDGSVPGIIGVSGTSGSSGGPLGSTTGGTGSGVGIGGGSEGIPGIGVVPGDVPGDSSGSGVGIGGGSEGILGGVPGVPGVPGVLGVLGEGTRGRGGVMGRGGAAGGNFSDSRVDFNFIEYDSFFGLSSLVENLLGIGKGSVVIFGFPPLKIASSFGLKLIPDLAGNGSDTGVTSLPTGSVLYAGVTPSDGTSYPVSFLTTVLGPDLVLCPTSLAEGGFW